VSNTFLKRCDTATTVTTAAAAVATALPAGATAFGRLLLTNLYCGSSAEPNRNEYLFNATQLQLRLKVGGDDEKQWRGTAGLQRLDDYLYLCAINLH
jgi:hypothetical protein